MAVAIGLIRLAQFTLRVQLVRLLIAVVLIGMAGSHRAWGKPLYTYTYTRYGPLNRIIRNSPPALIERGVSWLTHKAGQVFAAAASVAVAPLTHILQGHANRTRALNQSHAAFAEETAQATYRLRHNVLPREIHRSVTPVKVRANYAAHTAEHSISLWRKERAARRHGIDRLAKEIGALALGFLGIDYLVKHGHRAYHHRSHARADRATTHDIPAIKATQRTHARRLSRLEKVLGVTALTAVVAAVLARAIPSWRCSNFRNVRRLLRCSHWRWLEALLFLAVDALTLRDICQLVGVIERGAASFQPEIHALVVSGENFICGDGSHMPSALTAHDRADSPGFASALTGRDFAF